MRVLVTGGAGFIGSHIASAEASAGNEVTIVDDLSTGALVNVPQDCNFIQADLLDVRSVLEGRSFDIIYHFAGQSSGEVSAMEPLLDYRTNALSTLALLDWASERKPEAFVFASSMGVYGQRESIMPFRETDRPSPISNYGVSKLAAEHLCALYSQRGLQTRTLRLFNVYGPGQSLGNLRQGMLSIYLASLMRTGRVLVKGSLARVRDFVYIDDVVEAARLAASADHRQLTVNVCSGVGASVQEAVLLLMDAWDGEPSLDRLDVDVQTPYDQFAAVGDPDKALLELGWASKTPLMDGLRRMVSHARFTG